MHPNSEMLVWSGRNIEKRYGRIVATKAEAVDLFAGDTVFFQGPNGSGKSTLLRIVAGISRPTRGKIVKSREFNRGRIAFVGQSGGLYPDLTLAQNIKVQARLNGIRDELKTRSNEALGALGLESVLSRRAGELSGGYQRLGAIAVGLAIRPSILLLDEPLAGLDSEKVEAVQTALSLARPDLSLMIACHHHGDMPFEANRTIHCGSDRFSANQN